MIINAPECLEFFWEINTSLSFLAGIDVCYGISDAVFFHTKLNRSVPYSLEVLMLHIYTTGTDL